MHFSKLTLEERSAFRMVGAGPSSTILEIEGQECRVVHPYTDYAVARDGSVYRIMENDNQGIKRPCQPMKLVRAPSDTDYCSYTMRVDGIRRTIKGQKLVLLAFVGGPPTIKHVACHLDNNPQNNNLDNLMWGTYKVNESHKSIHGTRPIGERCPAHKLTDETVKQMRQERANGASATKLMKKFGIKRHAFYMAINRKAWKHVP